MVARLVRDQEAVGSSPVTSTKKTEIPKGVSVFLLQKAGLERLGSRNLTKAINKGKKIATKQPTERLFARQA